jgi:hypothetical protein
MLACCAHRASRYWRPKESTAELSNHGWEAEIGRITVRGQPGQIVHEIPISKITKAKWIGDVAQAVEHLLYCLKFKPQSHQNK